MGTRKYEFIYKLPQRTVLYRRLFSRINGCDSGLGARQELVKVGAYDVVDDMLLFITRVTPQGPTRLIGMF